MTDQTMPRVPRTTMQEWRAHCERRDRLTFWLGLSLGGFGGSFIALVVFCWLAG